VERIATVTLKTTIGASAVRNVASISRVWTKKWIAVVTVRGCVMAEYRCEGCGKPCDCNGKRVQREYSKAAIALAVEEFLTARREVIAGCTDCDGTDNICNYHRYKM
jgi:hypothetical protein